jgi:Zn-dependent metalloprotease
VHLEHQLVHPCGLPHVFCSIVPPDLLARLADEGQEGQRKAAIRTIAVTEAMRGRRGMIANLVRTRGADQLAALGLAPKALNRSVYDVENLGWDDLPGQLVRSEGDNLSADDAVNEAYDGADSTYTFYKDVFGRDSVDDAGYSLISCVHFGVDVDNAFWDGVEMVYGDGSDQIFRIGSLTTSIDVIGHELTHGVTQCTAGLVYSKQSGALNESFSDVFGSLVKQYSLGQGAAEADWLIGEGILVPELGQSLRSMSEPDSSQVATPQPAHMADYVDLPDDGDPRNDNGGVHINSGIPNKAFYLVATALGGNAWEVPGQIWYQTLTQRLGPASQFPDAAQATVEAAGELFGAGGSEEQAVQQAWEEVGVL